MKLAPLTREGAPDDQRSYIYWCPGCEDNHQIIVAPGYWGFDGDLERPTVDGSVLVRGSVWENRACHSYIRDGKIEFLSDSTHDLAGHTVEMLDWPVRR